MGMITMQVWGREMGETKKQSRPGVVEGGRSGGLVEVRLIWEACTKVVWCLGLYHVWAHDSTAAGVCVHVHGFCFHVRSYGCPCSRLPPGIMLMSEVHAVSGDILIWVTCTATKGSDIWTHAEANVWVSGYTAGRSVFMSMSHVTTKSHMDAHGLFCHLRSCWWLAVVLRWPCTLLVLGELAQSFIGELGSVVWVGKSLPWPSWGGMT